MDNQITNFKYLTNSVTELHCANNQISSFQYLPNSVNMLYCKHNQISSFKYLPNSVNILFCKHNQITSFQYLPIGVTQLDCANNPIKSTKYLISLGYINCDISIDKIKIHENRFNHGLIIISKIYNHKCTTKIIKQWQNYWYNELIPFEDTMMNRFGLASWKLMNYHFLI